ncbi:MAG: hypothetical protein ACYDHX_06635 [Methanothrix sp.]
MTLVLELEVLQKTEIESAGCLHFIPILPRLLLSVRSIALGERGRSAPGGVRVGWGVRGMKERQPLLQAG